MSIDPNQINYLKEQWLPDLKYRVPITIYVDGSSLSEIAKDFLSELEKISKGKVTVKTNFLNKSAEERFRVDRGPIIVIGKSENIIYIGLPLGYEIWTFYETIKIVSRKEHGLKKLARELNRTSKKLKIYTIVTPSCYYCSHSVKLANRAAIASKGKILSYIINGADYPEFIDKWKIMTVPTTIITDECGEEKFIRAGAVDEKEFIDKIRDMICEKIIC